MQGVDGGEGEGGGAGPGGAAGPGETGAGDGGGGDGGGDLCLMKQRKLCVSSFSGTCGYTTLVPAAPFFQFSQSAGLPGSGMRTS